VKNTQTQTLKWLKRVKLLKNYKITTQKGLKTFTSCLPNKEWYRKVYLPEHVASKWKNRYSKTGLLWTQFMLTLLPQPVTISIHDHNTHHGDPSYDLGTRLQWRCADAAVIVIYQGNASQKQRHVRTLVAAYKENKILHQSELKPTGIWILYIQFSITGQLYTTV